MNSMLTMSELLRDLEHVTLNKKEDVKIEKTRLRGVVAVFNTLVTRTSETLSRLKHNFNTKVDERATAEQKKRS